MSLLLKHVPQRRGKTLEGGSDAELLVSRIDLWIAAAGLGHARQVALDVGHKDRHAALRKSFSETLQRHGLTRARCTRDDTVPIGHCRQKKELTLVVLCCENWFAHSRNAGCRPACIFISE